MNIKNTKRLGALFVTWSVAMGAHAIAPGFYMGAQAGLTNTNNTTQNVQTGLASPATVPVTPTNTGMGERVFMGAGINEYAAFELGYTHYAASTYKPNPSNLSGTPSIRENGYDLVGKAMFPLRNFAVFGKLGVTSISRSLSGSLQPPPPSTSSTGSKNNIRPLAGVGVSYEITPNWITDITYTRAFKGGGGFQNADFAALGLSYHFVDKYCGQFLC